MKLHNNNKSNTNGQCAIVPLHEIKTLHGLSGSDVLVYLVLLAHKNKETGLAYPSASTIQQHTMLSRSSVMRSMKRLKDDKHIIKTDIKYRGVVAYKFATCTNLDTCTRSDTCTNLDTPTCTNLDTPTCTNLETQTVKETENKNTLLASTNDEKLFLLLWEKWKDHNLCKWSSINEPLSEYRMMKNEVLEVLKHKRIKKDFSLELQVIDIFIMQQLMKYGQDGTYEGSARVWSGDRVWSGLSKWLCSDTPSYINADKARFKRYMIKLEQVQQEQVDVVSIAETKHRQNDVLESEGISQDVLHFQSALKDIYEAFELHQDEDTLQTTLNWLYDDMNKILTPEQIETVKTKAGV